MAEVQNETVACEAHFTGTCAGTAIFTVVPFDESADVIANVRFDDLFGGNYLPLSFPHYCLNDEKITFDKTNVVDFMRDTLHALRAALKEREALREELRIRRTRTASLLLRAIECKCVGLRTIYTMTFNEVMGFYPSELHTMGIA